MDNKYFIEINRVIVIVFLFLLISESAHAQCYIVASERHRQRMQQDWGVYVEERQGNFASYEECVAYLDREISFDPAQRNEHWCECEETSSNYSDTNQNTNIIIPDRETQLNNARMMEEIELKKKAKLESQEVNLKKKDLLGKMKKNKALDQLKTSSELSEQGTQNTNNNQLDAGRNDTQSAFTEGKIILKKRDEQPIVPVSPPKPIDNQKSLFKYIEKETKTVQNKIINVQKEKIILLDKKNENHKTIYEQTIKIAQLKTERLEIKDETKIDEIDSLLLMASLLLQESEDLNKEADEELKEKNKIELDNQALLNKYQDVYNKSKENPEQSEQLLKELQGDKK